MRDQPLTSRRSSELHRPIVERFAEVIERGQQSGEFSDRLSPHWLVAAITALAHAAADEVDSGRMIADDAETALRPSQADPSHPVTRTINVTGTATANEHGTVHLGSKHE